MNSNLQRGSKFEEFKRNQNRRWMLSDLSREFEAIKRGFEAVYTRRDTFRRKQIGLKPGQCIECSDNRTYRGPCRARSILGESYCHFHQRLHDRPLMHHPSAEDEWMLHLTEERFLSIVANPEAWEWGLMTPTMRKDALEWERLRREILARKLLGEW
jgi:hypothetical protein